MKWLLCCICWWQTYDGCNLRPQSFLWPGGGQMLHNIHVKQPYYNAHISIITIIIVMGRFSVPSQWSVCLAKDTVAQSCDSGQSHWLLNQSWWVIVYHWMRRPRACKYDNEMPKLIQMSKCSDVPPETKKLWLVCCWEMESHSFSYWLKSRKLYSWSPRGSWNAK